MNPLPSDETKATSGWYLFSVWGLFVFLLHLSVVYLVANFCVSWLAGRIYDSVIPLLQIPSSESRFQFLFNHLAILGLLCGMLAAVVTAQYRHGAMKWVWTVPTAVVVYKFATYPSTLFENHFAVAFHHYFSAGFLIPEFHSYSEMFAAWSPEYVRGLDQMRYAAPAYAGIGYSAAGWLVMRFGLTLPNLGRWLQRTGPSHVNEPTREDKD